MLRATLGSKTKYGFIIALLALLLSLFFITSIAAAQENIKTGENIVLSKD